MIEPRDADEVRGERLTQRLVPLLGQAAAEAARLALAAELGLQRPNAGPGSGHGGSLTAVVATVDALARQSPLPMLFEDMHWADDSTAQLARDLARGMPSRRGLLLLTSRADAGVPVELLELRLPLLAVDQATSAELVRALASTGSVGKETIVHRREGVPLLLEELTRSLLQRTAPADLPADIPALASQVP